MVCFAPFEREDLTSYRNEVVDAAKRALVHGGDLPEVLAICAWGLGVVGGDLAFGLELAQRATELSPSSEAGWRIAGWIHLYLDDSEPAMACFNRAIRLAPMPGNPGALLGLSAVHFAAGRHDEVLLVTERALRYSPGFVMALRNRAASLGLLGRIDEGRRVVQQLRQLVPAFSLGYVRDHFRLDLNNAYRSPEMIEAMLDGLRRVGTPE